LLINKRTNVRRGRTLAAPGRQISGANVTEGAASGSCVGAAPRPSEGAAPRPSEEAAINFWKLRRQNLTKNFKFSWELQKKF